MAKDKVGNTIDDLIGYSYPSSDVIIINDKSENTNELKEEKSITVKNKEENKIEDLNSEHHDDYGEHHQQNESLAEQYR